MIDFKILPGKKIIYCFLKIYFNRKVFVIEREKITTLKATTLKATTLKATTLKATVQKSKGKNCRNASRHKMRENIYLACLSVCLSVCVCRSTKRQNGLIDRTLILCNNSRDVTPGRLKLKYFAIEKIRHYFVLKMHLFKQKSSGIFRFLENVEKIGNLKINN